MNNQDINRALYEGKIDFPGVLPHVEELQDISHIFDVDFGLKRLPLQPGLLIIRGPRQYGKSTWLEQEIQKTIKKFGPGTALYLNGDEIKNAAELTGQIEQIIPLFSKKSKVRRLFIDEITAVDSWEYALKRLIDRRLLKDILLVTTGSKASDLRHGIERLPGRKGKLDRHHYLFTPISYREFKNVCGKIFKSKTLIAYILTGGCPIACHEMAVHKKIPEYVVTMIRDWIYGECVASGRNRSSLLSVWDVLIKTGGSPVGQSKLAREAGLANNTVAFGYVELLGDLLTVMPSYAWDSSHQRDIKRKPAKFHLINLLTAIAWHPCKLRSVADFEQLPESEQAKFYEWLVAQELFRRASIRGEDMPEKLNFWQSKKNEIDFVVDAGNMIEVKFGKSSPLDFMWFSKVFQKEKLKIITTTPFETRNILGLTMEDFLLDE